MYAQMMHEASFFWEPAGGERLCAPRVVARKLEQLNAATLLETLRVPPGNRLEALSHNRQGQHSIRVNDQWRVCFVWRDANAFDVEIVDYH